MSDIERYDLISMRPFEVKTMNRSDDGDWVSYDEECLAEYYGTGQY
jgi:hypothetical protein